MSTHETFDERETEQREVRKASASADQERLALANVAAVEMARLIVQNVGHPQAVRVLADLLAGALATHMHPAAQSAAITTALDPITRGDLWYIFGASCSIPMELSRLRYRLDQLDF
jgi:hypothetical protein